jgi:hypothetical protein
MKFRPALALLPLFLWQCATPAPAVHPKPAVAALVSDDDHRAVSREEFQKSSWGVLPAVLEWKPAPGGVAVVLSDGREASMTFVSARTLRWWVPPAAGVRPLSPGARYPVSPDTKVVVREQDGILSLDTPDLGVRLKLEDLSWIVVRGDRTVLRTAGGPRIAGRRMLQAFSADSAARWFGPGLNSDTSSAKFWIDNVPNADNTGPWVAPVLFGAGGAMPFVVSLDNSYQTYTRVTAAETSLGALNGGLDLLVAADPQASGTVEALTSLTGRPAVPPLWAHGAALALPQSEPGLFIRKARLSIQTAAGPFRKDRSRFQVLLSGPASSEPLPDLTLGETRSGWITGLGASSWPVGAGIDLSPVAGRADWTARFDDEGQNSPLALMNNRLAGIEARTVTEAWRTFSPGLRPFILAESGGLGSIRDALPERRIAGQDDLGQVLALGVSGLGTPAIRLDLTPLSRPEAKEAAFRSLLSWLMAPILILDWGPDPAGFWAALDKPDQQRLKALLDQRSQFKPLFAQLARQSAASGLPAWRPLWFDSPHDPQTLVHDNEFLLGETILASAVPKSAASCQVYLPGPGVWFDFWSGEEFGGGRSYDVDVRPDKPLLFVRGGGLVPVREPEVYDDQDVYNPLTIHIFPAGRGTGTYWFDDGRTLAWKDGTYVETRVSYDFSQTEMEVDQQSLNAPTGLKPDPYVLYRLHNVYKPRQVRIDSKVIPLFGDSWGITDTDRSAAWYESDHTLLIKTFRPDKDQTIQMSF